MMKNCPKEKANLREWKEADIIQVEDGPPKRNRFYALRSKGDPKNLLRSFYVMCLFNDLWKFLEFLVIMNCLVILLFS